MAHLTNLHPNPEFFYLWGAKPDNQGWATSWVFSTRVGSYRSVLPNLSG